MRFASGRVFCSYSPLSSFSPEKAVTFSKPTRPLRKKKTVFFSERGVGGGGRGEYGYA